MKNLFLAIMDIGHFLRMIPAYLLYIFGCLYILTIFKLQVKWQTKGSKQ